MVWCATIRHAVRGWLSGSERQRAKRVSLSLRR
jgi:hypothetical protein